MNENLWLIVINCFVNVNFLIIVPNMFKYERKRSDSHSFMQRPVHLSYGQVKRLWTGKNIGGRVKKGAKKDLPKP